MATNLDDTKLYEKVRPGYLRINDIEFDVPPNKITIIKREFSQDVATLRSQVPKVIKSGRRMVSMIVELTFATGYIASKQVEEEISPWINRQLSPLLIQTRKCPFVYIENEKIRREVIGVDDVEHSMAATIKSISMSSEVRDSELLKVTLMMDVFNFTPYTPDFYFKEIDPISGQEFPSRQPGSLFKEFYRNGTMKGTRFVNEINSFNGSGFEILYKQYAELSLNQPKSALKKFVEDTSTREELASLQQELNSDNPRGPISGLARLYRGSDTYERNFVESELFSTGLEKLIQEAGWYKDDIQYKIEPAAVLLYRYKIFRVEPGVELDSGKMIVEAASAGLETHTPNIVLQSHTIPTAQFLGASSANITMQIFANAELEGEEPVGTSKRLMEFSKILEEVNLDAILYHRQSINDSIFLKHPMAKLSKYKQYRNKVLPTKVYDPYTRSTIDGIDVNDYLACSVESMSSETVVGHPYCSRVTIGFIENFINQESNIKSMTTGAGQTAFENFKAMILKLDERYGISQVSSIRYDRNKPVYEKISFGGKVLTDDELRANPSIKYYTRQVAASSSRIKQNFAITKTPKENNPAEAKLAERLLQALNLSSQLDYSGLDPSLTGFPFSSLAQALDHPYTIKVSKGIVSDLIQSQTGSKISAIGQPFTSEEFQAVGQGLIVLSASGQLENDPYSQYTEIFSKTLEVPDESTYPDMMLPDSFPQPDHAWFNLTDYRNNKKQAERLFQHAFDTRRLVGAEMGKYRDPKKMPQELKDKEFIPVTWGPAPALNPMFSSPEAFKDGLPFGQAPLDESQQIKSMARSIDTWEELTYTMRRSMPTFKIYFKEDLPETEDGSLEASPAWRNLSDVYDLNGIIDVRLSKKHDNPADLLVIRMTNSRQDFMSKYYTVRNLSNSEALADSRNKRRVRNAATPDEASKSYRALHARGDAKVLREGTRVELRLGYDNNPNNLSVEFTGRIMSANGTDILEIICQGDGAELVQDLKGVGGQAEELDTNTGKLIAEFLESAPEVQSFGTIGNNTKWFGDVILPVNFGGRSAVENIFAPTLYSGLENFGESLKYSTWAATAAVALTAAAPFTGGLTLPLAGAAASLSTFLFGAGLVVDGAKALKLLAFGVPFKVYEQTVWDVLQELTMRHPGVICAVVPFGQRSTIFFGYPDQLYFHRPATYAERAVLAAGPNTNKFTKTTLRDVIVNKNSRVFGTTELDRDQLNELSEDYQKGKLPHQAMKPFINYHVVTSMHDIVFNEIQVTTDDVYNAVRIVHPDNSGLIDSAEVNIDGSVGFDDYKQTDTIQADDDLIRNYIKLQTLVFHNAANYPLPELPEKYAFCALANNLQNIYSGKVTILGRPQVKPHDIVFIEDFYSGISGPVKVGAVTHVLSYKTGWITEIHPKMVVSHYSATLIDQVRAMKEVAKTVALQNLSTFQSGYIGTVREPNDLGKNIRDTIGPGGESLLRSFLLGKAVGATSKVLFKAAAADFSTRYSQKLAEFNAITSGKIDYKNVLKVKNGLAYRQFTGKVPFTSRTFSGAVPVGRASAGFAKVPFAAPTQAQAASKYASKAASKSGALWKGAKVASRIPLLAWFADAAITNYVSWSRTRQPIAYEPLMRGGVPWVMGLHGFLNNTEEQAMAKVVGKFTAQTLNFAETYMGRLEDKDVVYLEGAVEKAEYYTEKAWGGTTGAVNYVLDAPGKSVDFFSELIE